MGAVSIILCVVALLIVLWGGSGTGLGDVLLRIVAILIALGGGYMGAQQAQADKEAGESPALSYVGVALCLVAVALGAVFGIVGCFRA